MLQAKQEMRKKNASGEAKKSNIGLSRIETSTGQVAAFTSKTHDYCWGSHWHATFGWGYKCCFSHNMDDLKCGGEAAKLKQMQIYKEAAEKPSILKKDIADSRPKPETDEDVESQSRKRQRHDSESD